MNSSDSENEHLGRKALLNEKAKKTVQGSRTLILSRNLSSLHRHLMKDLHVLLPHSKKDAKLPRKLPNHSINELADLQNCNNSIFFESDKHNTLYMWLSLTPNGPSAKFLVQNCEFYCEEASRES
jgi:ribosome biogenesis protein BRX1